MPKCQQGSMSHTRNCRANWLRCFTGLGTASELATRRISTYDAVSVSKRFCHKVSGLFIPVVFSVTIYDRVGNVATAEREVRLIRQD